MENTIFNIIANYIKSMEGDILTELYPNKYKNNPRTINDLYYDFICVCENNTYKIGLNENLEVDFIRWI